MCSRACGSTVGSTQKPSRGYIIRMQDDKRRLELERARRRRDEAAQGSPDWDAASEAVLELEAHESTPLADQFRRRLFLVDSQTAS